MSNEVPRESDSDRLQKRQARIDEIVFDHVQSLMDGAGETLESLLSRHPDLLPELEEQLRLLAELSDQPASNDKQPTARQRSGQRTLQIRCPHCQQPVEVLPDTPFTDITCSTCGSQFNLVKESDGPRAACSYQKLAHFELVERLGSGSFGTVWKARDTQLDRTVAVKIPRHEKTEPCEVEQFLREARAAAQLSHPNIVTVYEVGRDDQTVFIVSDLIRGVPLSDWLTGQRPTFRESAQMCATIADALHHAHEEGVIHRDLKPQNIMLDGNSQPHLMDFGLARRDMGEITMTIDGHVLGTPAYMSPEQARGEAHRADRRSDIYSLGVILFELLTAELPFRGNSRMLIHQVLHEDAPSPRKLNGSVPKDLETICLKCLEKEPHKRFDNAQVVAEELRRFLAGRPIQARPISAWHRTWRWCRRYPIPASLATLLAIAVIVVSVLWISAERTSEQLRRKLYTYSVSRAAAAQHDNNIVRMREVLDACPADLRHWEWNRLNNWAHQRSANLTLLPDNQLDLSVRTFEVDSAGLEGPANDVAIGTGGRWIATSGQQGSVKLWDDAGRLLDSLVGHNANVQALAASPTKAWLASGDRHGILMVRDVDRKRVLWKRTVHGESVRDLAFGIEGNCIASVSDDMTVKVWKAESGELIWEAPVAMDVHQVSMAPGRIVAVSNWRAGQKMRLWDVAKNREVKQPQFDTTNVSAVAFWASSGEVAVGRRDGQVEVWHVDGSKPRRLLLGHRHPPNTVTRVAFSPDGDRLASSSYDNTVKLWDLQTGNLVRTLYGHSEVVSRVLFTPDGKRVVTSSWDRTVKVWNVDLEPDTLVLQGHEGEVRAVAFNPAGTQVVSAGAQDGTIRLWDVASGQFLRLIGRHEGRAYGVAVSPNGSEAISCGANGLLKCWDLRTGESRWSVEVHPSRVYSVAYHPIGERIVSTGEDGLVREFDAASGKLLNTFADHGDGVIEATYSHDGSMLASVGEDGRLNIWNAKSGALIRRLVKHTDWANATAFSPDDRFVVSAGEDNRLVLWDLATGKPQWEVVGLADDVESVAFSPDGKRVFSVDRVVRIWNAENGDELLTLQGHEGLLRCVRVSPDGNTLASCGFDGTVRLWRTSR